MKLCRCVFLLLFALCGCGAATRAQPQAQQARATAKNVSVYFSPGSNNVRGDLVPLSSAPAIDEVFDAAQKDFGATRVLWRGLQEEDYARNEVFRPENLWLDEIWKWSRHLSLDARLNRHAVRSAHRRGMTIWGLTSVFEFGAEPREAVYVAMEFGPAATEDKLRVRHREWIPVDRYGIRRQTGPLEFAYPEARRALIDQLVKETLRHDYDGLMLLTYVENTDQWFEDEFGFNAPVVQEFKRRYGVDIRTQAFDLQAWRDLRGEYVTQFLRELKTALHARRKKLGVAVDPKRPHRAQPWLGNPTPTANAGSLTMDWKRWAREGIVDEIMVGSLDGSAEFAQQVEDAKPPVDVAFSVLSHPKGPREALTSTPAGWNSVLSGSVPAFEAQLAPPGSGVLAKRQSIRKLVDRGLESLPAIESMLSDGRHAVRVAAVVALGKVFSPSTPLRIFRAVERSGNAQFNYEAAQSLSKMNAEATPAIVAGLDSRSVAVRRVAAEALRSGVVRAPAIPRLMLAINDSDAMVRWAATLCVGRWGGTDESTRATATGVLLPTMHDAHPTVRAAAASALGDLFAGGRGDSELRKQVLRALGARFREFGASYRLADKEWGFRTPGRALDKFGSEGQEFLKALLGSSDTTLADHAWRALYLPPASAATEASAPADADQFYQLHPFYQRAHSRKPN